MVWQQGQSGWRWSKGTNFQSSVSSGAQPCPLSVSPWTVAHQAPCPAPAPGVHPNSDPSSQWCQPAILASCRPLLLLPSIFPSIRVFFQWVSSSHQVAKYYSFSFSISPSSEDPGLISFRMDWLDLLAVQGTLKSLLQHLSSKASILQHSDFFTVRLSHPFMTTGKTIALTRPTFVG